MKIKTITCHDCYNLGASLQAFALQYYLNAQGHDVQIIHYKPDYLSNHFNLWSVNNPIYDLPVVKQLYLIAKLPNRIKSLSHKRVFDQFTAKYLKLTKRYNSYEELKADPPAAEVYIAGSDQIWNTSFPNGRDAAFYLDFGFNANLEKARQIKRISYAASFSTSDISPEYREFVIKGLKNFDCVSIRERTSLSLLRSLGRPDGVAVCDPVFLLSKDEWISILQQDSMKAKDLYSTSEKYILVYLTDRSDVIKEIALKMKIKMGWKIYVVGSFKEKWADKNFDNAGPLDFVRLINNAQYVISNSFHGTAFSLILEKNFCVINRQEDINERMKSILSDYDLEERLINTYADSLLLHIAYDVVNVKKEVIVSESKEWLKMAIEDSSCHSF